MKTIIPVYLLIFSLFLASTTIAQQEKDYDSLHKYIKQAVKDFEVPGLAVGIIKNNEIVLLEGYGYRNTVSRNKVDENTVFGIASCSKAFAAAMMIMISAVCRMATLAMA